MRIQFASDLHLEYLNRRFPDFVRVARLGSAEADLLILAGDIHVDTHMVEKFGRWEIPVLYVPGNHEFYDTAIHPQVERIHLAARDSAMRALFRDEWISGGVRFLGCTLWTNYQLMGTGGRQLAAMLASEARIADHRKIMGIAGKTVVITHHAPSRGSVHPRFRGDPCNAAFVSDLDDLVEKADIWIHGHVHDSFDYQVGKCRVLANPGSYATTIGKVKSPEALDYENPLFDPAKTITLAT